MDCKLNFGDIDTELKAHILTKPFEDYCVKVVRVNKKWYNNLVLLDVL